MLTQKKEFKWCSQYQASVSLHLSTYPSHCLHALFLLPAQSLLALVVQLPFSEGKKKKTHSICSSLIFNNRMDQTKILKSINIRFE